MTPIEISAEATKLMDAINRKAEVLGLKIKVTVRKYSCDGSEYIDVMPKDVKHLNITLITEIVKIVAMNGGRAFNVTCRNGKPSLSIVVIG